MPLTNTAAKIHDALTFPIAEVPEYGAVQEIAPGILWFRIPLPFQLDHVNIYLIEDGDGWAVVEWECALKHPEDGAREGAQFVKDHIIRVTPHAFDDFANAGTDEAANRRMLGLER